MNAPAKTASKFGLLASLLFAAVSSCQAPVEAPHTPASKGAPTTEVAAPAPRGIITAVPAGQKPPAGQPATRAAGEDGPRDEPAPSPTSTIAGEPEPHVNPPAEIRAYGKIEGVKAPSDPQGSPIPVDRHDPQWGSPQAPVTLVHFSDLQCPYCARANSTVEELTRDYGPRQLRVVFKHFPLRFHKQARPAAELGEAIRLHDGNRAFFRYLDAAFTGLGKKDPLSDIVTRLGLSVKELQTLIDSGKPARKVDEDLALVAQIGIRGTPTFYINGVFLSGAQPKNKFVKIIDEQLAAAKKAWNSGIAKDSIYAHLSKKQYTPPGKPTPKPKRPTEDSSTVWKVPIGKSPTLGPANAPVTIVMFKDFECPFCKRSADTLETLRKKYGKKVRLVFKHNPLAFHKRAIPAAQLAIEALRRQGPAGFWRAYHKLFENIASLEDADLERIANELHLNRQLTMAAISRNKHRAVIQADQDLATALKARGTPQFFINGRRLKGSQPLEKFATIVEEELKHAADLRAKGVPAHRIYAAIQKTAKVPGAPESRKVAAPTKENPSLGSRFAPVTIQIFSDFQCPYCERVLSTLDEVRIIYGKRVRFVFRHRPLSFHKRAVPAAIAAHEVFLQRGSRGFWAMHDLLFENRRNLDRDNLVKLAVSVGADQARVEHALDSSAHQAFIEREVKIADAADIHGTPAFMVNEYFLAGAQPLSKFRRVIDYALKNRKR